MVEDPRPCCARLAGTAAAFCLLVLARLPRRGSSRPRHCRCPPCHQTPAPARRNKTLGGLEEFLRSRFTVVATLPIMRAAADEAQVGAEQADLMSGAVVLWLCVTLAELRAEQGGVV